MRTLVNALHDLEAGDLRIIAERWGFDPASDTPAGIAHSLCTSILHEETLSEFLDGLTDGEQAVLNALREHNGRLPLADAERKFGAWRRMGPARRDRVQPHHSPSGPLESLAYTGLIARAFAEGSTGPLEYVYLPVDLLALLPGATADLRFGQPADPPPFVLRAVPTAAEDAVTILAALRRGGVRSLPPPAAWFERIGPFLFHHDSAPLLTTLLFEAGVIGGVPLRPQAEPTRELLETTHSAPWFLLDTWKASARWNDLAQVSTIACETPDWPGNPSVTRQALLEALGFLAVGVWWDLDSVVGAIREERPGFQRTAGEFDSWYLRDRTSGAFLRGFQNWEAVEGALIRYVLSGPLHWLGAADLGTAAPGGRVEHFRLTTGLGPGGAAAAASPPAEAPAQARLLPDGLVEAPLGMTLTQRYQLARFCDWESRHADGFTYRLTPSAIRAALEQGLHIPQVIALLESATGRPVPTNLRQAISRLAEGRQSARLEHGLILRLGNSQTLEELRASSLTARYLGDAVGTDGVVVRSGDWPRLRAAAARLGILIDAPESAGPPHRRR